MRNKTALFRDDEQRLDLVGETTGRRGTTRSGLRGQEALAVADCKAEIGIVVRAGKELYFVVAPNMMAAEIRVTGSSLSELGS